MKVVAFAHHGKVLDAIQAGVVAGGIVSAHALVWIYDNTKGAARQSAVHAVLPSLFIVPSGAGAAVSHGRRGGLHSRVSPG